MMSELPRRTLAWQTMQRTVVVMSMTQLIVSAAPGFVITQSALYGIRYSFAWLQRKEVRPLIRAMIPSPSGPVGARASAPLRASPPAPQTAARSARSARGRSGSPSSSPGSPSW
jgi:hypothetical protein